MAGSFGSLHGVENAVDEICRNVFVKKVAHLPGPHAVLIAGASTLAECANALQTLKMGEIHRRISAFCDSRKIQVKVHSDQRPFFRDCFQEGSVR